LYWKRCNAIGVYAGLGSGVLVWAYMLITPIMSDIGLVAQSYISQGPYGFEWLSPEFFLGFEFSDAFTRSVLVSLGINIAVTWLVSRVDRTTLADRIQASTFTQIELQKPVGENDSAIKIGDLKELANQFAGARIADRIFEPESINPEETSPEELIETVRRALSGIAGVASANAMIDGLRSGNKIAVEDVVSMFGETTKALRFNQEILFSSFENISSGISVVNDDLNIVAWNRRYEEMFNYPKNMLKIGTPVSELVQFNAHRGLLGAGDIELLVHKRLEHLKNGKPYRVVREHHDGQVIEIKGTPLPDGGYVTTYDDISDFIRIQNELELSNQNLEKRVESRTEEINRINQDLVHEIELRKGMETALLEAKSQAETANATKSR
ncbi:PAS-domain containing protein, partial [Oleiphilus sp. HI0080]